MADIRSEESTPFLLLETRGCNVDTSLNVHDGSRVPASMTCSLHDHNVELTTTTIKHISREAQELWTEVMRGDVSARSSLFSRNHFRLQKSLSVPASSTHCILLSISLIYSSLRLPDLLTSLSGTPVLYSIHLRSADHRQS